MNLSKTLRPLSLAVVLLTGTAFAAAPVRFGIAHFDGDGQLKLLMPQALGPSQEVKVQFPDERFATQCCKTIRSSAVKPIVDHAHGAPQTFLYLADVPASWATLPFIGMAVTGHQRIEASGQDRLDVTNLDGTRSEARLCTSHEGVHLTELRGRTVATHLYLRLGYDIDEPTCGRALPAGATSVDVEARALRSSTR